MSRDQQTVHSLLAAAARTVQAASSTPRLDVELLLAHVLGWSRAQLLAETEHLPEAQQIAAFHHLVARRANQEPVAYLLSHREFFGLDLLVDQRVLIPRPETELLVELALAMARQRSNAPGGSDLSPALTIADIGTGSGAIAIALARHLPQASIYATDISPDALDVARQNILRCSVEQRVHLLKGDLLNPLPASVDMIVSNPPYTILATIDDDVRRYQPHLALDGGSDGLHIYRRLLAQIPRWLRPGGAILLETGALQALRVSQLLQNVLPSFHITVHRDLAGWDRVVVGVDR